MPQILSRIRPGLSCRVRFAENGGLFEVLVRNVARAGSHSLRGAAEFFAYNLIRLGDLMAPSHRLEEIIPCLQFVQKFWSGSGGIAAQWR